MAKQIHIYIPNESDFRKLQLEVKSLWYKKYGEALSQSDLVIRSYETLRDVLSERGGRTKDDIKRQTIYKYCRTGIQD